MAIAGKKGKLSIKSGEDNIKVVGIKSWSLSLNLDTYETTELGSEWKAYISGLKEWTASGEGNFEVSTDEQGQKALQDSYLNGTPVDLALYVDDTHYYGGNVIVNSLSIEDPVDNIVSFSCEFTGNGELSFE